jgi:long-chain acyl-CoA synthetase
MPPDTDSASSQLAIEQVASNSDQSVEIDEATAIPELLLANAREHPDGTAIRWKLHGYWHEYTWDDYYDHVEAFALGLTSLGFGSGDILFTIGYNRPHQLWAWLGAQSLGGMAAPNYEDMLPEDLLDQLQLVEPSVLYAEDQEIVDRVLQIHDECPSLETIIFRDEKGMFRYQNLDINMFSYDTIESRGRELKPGEGRSEDLIDRIRGIDVKAPALLTPTSGTTGTPKRVKLSHFNLVNIGNSMYATERLPPESDHFSYLPFAWAGEQLTLLGQALVSRWTANFPEEPETESGDFREIAPEAVVASPSRYEKWVADIKANIENTTTLKRWVYNVSMRVGDWYADYQVGEKRDQDPPLTVRAAHWLCHWILYRPILDKIGLKRGKNVYTGGAPLGEEHFRYFHQLGVPLKQIWGQTEVSGYVTVHRDDDIRIDTVGEVLPNTEVAVTQGGELLVRGPVVTEGYYKQPDKTAEAIEDGWLHTDDFGAITDDGHVRVIDRMDDVIDMADGTSVSPIRLETKLKFNSYVKEVMVVGEEEEFLAAIINIRYDNVAEWADQHDIQYTGYRDLSQKPQVLELIRGIVAETNEKLDEKYRIQRFVSLFKILDPDDGELTQTGKLRRTRITQRYAELIESVFSGDQSVDLSVEISYQDGRQSTEQGQVRIVDVNESVDQEPERPKTSVGAEGS